MRRSLKPKNSDSAEIVDLGAGAVVQTAWYQGARRYQEDRYHVAAGTPLNGVGDLENLFVRAAQLTLAYQNEGSTATAALITPDRMLHLAWLGDSPALLVVHDKVNDTAAAVKLTRDHHAAHEDEREAIRRRGGTVSREGRAGGSLLLSRAFGDASVRGLSRIPDTAQQDLSGLMQPGCDVYVVLASDGMLESEDPPITPAECGHVLRQAAGGNMAEALARHAWKRGSTDNMTVLVLKVPDAVRENIFLSVADGHGGGLASEHVITIFRAATRVPPPGPGTTQPMPAAGEAAPLTKPSPRAPGR